MLGPRPHIGFHPFARLAHFGWLWLLVAFVVVDSFLRNRAVAVAAAAIVVLIVATIGMAHTRDAGHLAGVRIEDPILAFIGAAAAGLCVRDLQITPVLADAAIVAAGGIMVREIAGAKDYHGAPLYAGAFAGGTSIAVFANMSWVLAAGLITGVLWSVSREAWVGIGGKLGTISLWAVLVVSVAATDMHRLGPGADLLPTRQAVGEIVAIGMVSAVLAF